jgi:hypothetical protein
VNTDRILELADVIEGHKLDLGFNMASFADHATLAYPDKSGHDCGTTACIAGWAIAMKKGTWIVEELALDVMGNMELDVDKEASSYLEIGYSTSADLFYRWPTGTMPGEVTPELAAATLRLLAETGRVDWDEARLSLSREPG